MIATHTWLKDNGRQPTASLKDRASAIAVVKAKEKEARIITTASTGKAAAALSGLCASAQQANVIFVPETAPQAKIAPLPVFGSRVFAGYRILDCNSGSGVRCQVSGVREMLT